MIARAALADDDAPGADGLAAVEFDAQPLAVRLAAVANGTLTFFMCHRYLTGVIQKPASGKLWPPARGVVINLGPATVRGHQSLGFSLSFGLPSSLGFSFFSSSLGFSFTSSPLGCFGKAGTSSFVPRYIHCAGPMNWMS